MLSWIVRILKQRKESSRRDIFAFFDGSKKRLADPLRIWLKLNDDSHFVAGKHLSLIDEGDLESIGIAVNAVRRAFDVVQYSEGGLTDQQCLELLFGFLVWTETQKKSTKDTPTLPLPTESASLATSNTKPFVGSPSTESELN